MKEENETKPRTFAICDLCQQEMCPGQGCTLSTITSAGITYDRIKAGDGGDYEPITEPGDFCHDCNVTLGQYHHLGCDMERCPVCHGQIIGCGCCEID